MCLVPAGLPQYPTVGAAPFFLRSITLIPGAEGLTLGDAWGPPSPGAHRTSAVREGAVAARAALLCSLLAKQVLQDLGRGSLVTTVPPQAPGPQVPGTLGRPPVGPVLPGGQQCGLVCGGPRGTDSVQRRGAPTPALDLPGLEERVPGSVRARASHTADTPHRLILEDLFPNVSLLCLLTRSPEERGVRSSGVLDLGVANLETLEGHSRALSPKVWDAHACSSWH